jgi:hypothetical protein
VLPPLFVPSEVERDCVYAFSACSGRFFYRRRRPRKADIRLNVCFVPKATSKFGQQKTGSSLNGSSLSPYEGGANGSASLAVWHQHDRLRRAQADRANEAHRRFPGARGLIKEANSFLAAQFEKRSLADVPARRKVSPHDVQQSSDKWPVLILSRRASS